jgi:MoaA/NifB/PqqE/SkfB family radical SAM enzyme
MPLELISSMRKFFGRYAHLVRKRGATIRPSKIRLEMSSHCQLRCPSCPTTTKAIHPAVGSGFLKPADFRALLDANPRLTKIEMSNYGEIFLNPGLLEIFQIAQEHGVRLDAANGVNLNTVSEALLEAVVKYRVISLTCSIDGASNETYALYRVNGHFDKVISNIRAINRFKLQYRSKEPRLRWQFVVFGHNEHELPVARKLAAELGMEFEPKLSWDPAFSPVRDRDLVRQEVGYVSRQEYRDKVGRDYKDGLCGQLWNHPQINWDGKVLGCGRNFWGDFAVENVFKDGLLNSVNSEKMTYARGMLMGKNEAREDIPCATCEIYHDRLKTNRWM